MPAKRKSSGGGPVNSKASKQESEASKYPHIQQICDWFPGVDKSNMMSRIESLDCRWLQMAPSSYVMLRLKDCVVAAGGPDRYLTSKYSTKAVQILF